MRRLLISLATASALALPFSAQAWGAWGHRLVAELAEGLLDAPARSAVQAALALEPGQTLPSISTWADEVRSPETAAWHYVNHTRGANCSDPTARLCVQGMCVTDALSRQTAIWHSAAPLPERLLALKYVVHFAGDIHQPLHAGYADDRGGNSFQLQTFWGKGSNLHAVWDSGLIANAPGGSEALKAEVLALLKQPALATKPDTPAQWATQSCEVVAQPGFYPATRWVDEAYLAAWRPTLVRQLADAARRLAGLLNGTDTAAP